MYFPNCTQPMTHLQTLFCKNPLILFRIHSILSRYGETRMHIVIVFACSGLKCNAKSAGLLIVLMVLFVENNLRGG